MPSLVTAADFDDFVRRHAGRIGSVLTSVFGEAAYRIALSDTSFVFIISDRAPWLDFHGLAFDADTTTMHRIMLVAWCVSTWAAALTSNHPILHTSTAQPLLHVVRSGWRASFADVIADKRFAAEFERLKADDPNPVPAPWPGAIDHRLSSFEDPVQFALAVDAAGFIVKNDRCLIAVGKHFVQFEGKWRGWVTDFEAKHMPQAPKATVFLIKVVGGNKIQVAATAEEDSVKFVIVRPGQILQTHLPNVRYLQ